MQGWAGPRRRRRQGVPEVWPKIGVSGARRVSGLSCGFGRHVPPELVGLSFKCKAKTLTSGSATVLRAKMSTCGMSADALMVVKQAFTSDLFVNYENT